MLASPTLRKAPRFKALMGLWVLLLLGSQWVSAAHDHNIEDHQHAGEVCSICSLSALDDDDLAVSNPSQKLEPSKSQPYQQASYSIKTLDNVTHQARAPPTIS